MFKALSQHVSNKNAAGMFIIYSIYTTQIFAVCTNIFLHHARELKQISEMLQKLIGNRSAIAKKRSISILGKPHITREPPYSCTVEKQNVEIAPREKKKLPTIIANQNRHSSLAAITHTDT